MTSTRNINTCELNDWQWLKIKQQFDANQNNDHNNSLVGPIGVAIVGLGRMGSIHMGNVLGEPRARLLYCLDGDQSRLDHLASLVYFKKSSSTTTTTTTTTTTPTSSSSCCQHLTTKFIHSDQFDEALKDANVHVVIIATPTSSHEFLVTRSIQAGKNVLCEKPLTQKICSILPLYELAEKHQVFLVTAFNRHYDPDWRRMRQLTCEGRIGSIQLIRIISRNGGLPNVGYLKVCGSVFHDTCIHDLAMMLWLMRQLPNSVQVTARTWKQYCDSEPHLFDAQMSQQDLRDLSLLDDYFLAVITLQFGDGSIGVIDSARYATYGNDQRCEIYGARGMLKGDARPTSMAQEWNERGVQNAPINYNFASRYATAYKAELEDMLSMATLALGGKYFNYKKGQASELVHEYPRGSLVAAAAQMADVCLEAAKSSGRVAFNWSQELRERFDAEIKL